MDVAMIVKSGQGSQGTKYLPEFPSEKSDLRLKLFFPECKFFLNFWRVKNAALVLMFFVFVSEEL